MMKICETLKEKITDWYIELQKNYYTSEKPYCCSITCKKTSLSNWKTTHWEINAQVMFDVIHTHRGNTNPMKLSQSHIFSWWSGKSFDTMMRVKWLSQWIFQFKQWEEEAWKKKSGLQRDLNPWPPRTHRQRGGHGFESHWSPDFFRLLLSNCLNWKIHCDDHSSLSSITAVQKMNYFIYFTSFHSLRGIWTQ